MNPTTINRIPPFDLTELQSRISKNKSESDLLITVLKKNHSLALKQELEVNENPVSTEEIAPLDNKILPNVSSSEINVPRSQLRKRISKFDLTKRTSDIVNQRNAEREKQTIQPEKNITSITTSYFCVLL